jgi:hypothetical protein
MGNIFITAQVLPPPFPSSTHPVRDAL